MENSRNLFITIALSIVILTGWQFLYINPRIEAQRLAAQVELDRQKATGEVAAPNADSTVPLPAGNNAVPGQTVPTATAAVSREVAIAGQPRILIDTPKLGGTINLQGARFDDIVLKDYRVEVAKTSDNIVLLHPANLPNGFFAETGYTGTADAGTLPGPDDHDLVGDVPAGQAELP